MPFGLAKMTGILFVRWLLVLVTIPLVGSIRSYGLDGVNTSPSANPALVWCSIIDFTLMGHVYNSTVTKNHKLCWKACMVHSHCVSANFASESGRCELSNASHYVFPNDLSERSGLVYTYSQLQTTCQQPIPTKKNEQMEANFGWPLGTYGLPMPAGGCPTDAGFTWKTGYRFHDTEDSDSANEWSTTLHLKDEYRSDNMAQHFCMKTVDRVDDNNVEWPLGAYCVFKSDQDCPNRMLSGSIYWDDEDSNNQNTANGTVPSGEYNSDTRIDYCCMVNGNSSQPIALPTHNPFYLFAYNAECQEVQGMTVSREWFKWDNEDGYLGLRQRTNPIGSHPYYEEASGTNNQKIYYCYYETTNKFVL